MYVAIAYRNNAAYNRRFSPYCLDVYFRRSRAWFLARERGNPQILGHMDAVNDKKWSYF